MTPERVMCAIETDRDDWKRRALAAEADTTRIGQASVMMKNIADKCEAGDVVCAVSEKQWRAVVDERDSLKSLLAAAREYECKIGKELNDAIKQRDTALLGCDEWKRRGIAAETEEGKIRSELVRARDQIAATVKRAESAEMKLAATVEIAAQSTARAIKAERAPMAVLLGMMRNDTPGKDRDQLAQAKPNVELLANVAEWHEREAARLKVEAGRFLSMIDDASSGGKP